MKNTQMSSVSFDIHSVARANRPTHTVVYATTTKKCYNDIVSIFIYSIFPELHTLYSCMLCVLYVCTCLIYRLYSTCIDTIFIYTGCNRAEYSIFHRQYLLQYIKLWRAEVIKWMVFQFHISVLLQGPATVHAKIHKNDNMLGTSNTCTKTMKSSLFHQLV